MVVYQLHYLQSLRHSEVHRLVHMAVAEEAGRMGSADAVTSAMKEEVEAEVKEDSTTGDSVEVFPLANGGEATHYQIESLAMEDQIGILVMAGDEEEEAMVVTGVAAGEDDGSCSHFRYD